MPALIRHAVVSVYVSLRKFLLAERKIFIATSLKSIILLHSVSQRFNFKKYQLTSTFTNMPRNPYFHQLPSKSNIQDTQICSKASANNH